MNLSNVLGQLSEESLYKLKRLLDDRARRVALKVQEGDPLGDLEALRLLYAAVEQEHTRKLNHVD